MPDGLETLDGLAADALGGGIGGDQLGVLAFERFELGVEAVAPAVGDLGRGLDVVAAVVVADLLPQTLDPAPNVRLLRRAGIIRKARMVPKSR